MLLPPAARHIPRHSIYVGIVERGSSINRALTEIIRPKIGATLVPRKAVDALIVDNLYLYFPQLDRMTFARAL